MQRPNKQNNNNLKIMYIYCIYTNMQIPRVKKKVCIFTLK